MEGKNYESLDLSEENWILLLKSHTVYSKKNEKFEEYLDNIDNGNSALILESPVKIILYKRDGQFFFTEDGAEGLKFSSEDEFLKLLLDFDTLDKTSLIILEEDFLEVKELNLQEVEKAKLEEYYQKIKEEGPGVFLDNISFSEGDSITKFMAVEILSDRKTESFALKFCNGNFSCRTSQKMKYEILESTFENISSSIDFKEFLLLR